VVFWVWTRCVFSTVGGFQEIADERRCLPASSAGFSGIGRHLLHHTMSKSLLTYLTTYLLLEKLTGSQLASKFPAFYGTRGFINAFTYVQVPATCPYPEPDQSSPCPLSHFLNTHLNIILPSTPGSSKWCRQPEYRNIIFIAVEDLKSYTSVSFVF
jgi:hypothetical protein